MENTRGSHHGGVGLQAEGNRHPEMETQQLLPSTPTAHSRTNTHRSHRASISNVSSVSSVEPGGERKYSYGFICTARSNTHSEPQWMPFALRWHFITTAAGFSISCAAITFALYRYSHNNNGLCAEDSAMPGWKFIPTLIAVVYTQLTGIILGAVKRTGPFARMGKTDGRIPVARYTLLEKAKPWWTTLTRGFQRRRNGGSWNWVTILSCGTYILAILGISPMSAALLRTKGIHQTSPETLARLAMRNGLMLQPRAERDTYLRTMGAIFQNYSSSPWITDEFVILPFWSRDSVDTGSRWDYKVQDSGTWEANTTVFHADLVCAKLDMKKNDMYLRHAPEEWQEDGEKFYQASVLLESNNGCQFNLTVNVSDTALTTDWISWSDINNITSDDYSMSDAIVQWNEHCHEDEIIMMSSPWLPRQDITPIDEFLQNMTMLAYACHTNHSMATIPTRATASSGTLSVEFDENLFHQIRTPVPPTVLDLLELRKAYTDIKWSDFVPHETKTSDIEIDLYDVPFTGPAAILGEPYNFSIPRMMADSQLPVVAAQFRRRFFAEIVGGSLQRTEVLEERSTAGHRLGSVRIVLVSGQAACIICALLLICFVFFLGILWETRAAKTTLNISQDPSTLLGTSIWGSGDAMVLRGFTKLDLATRKTLKEELAGKVFYSKHGKLRESEANIQDDHESTYLHNCWCIF